MHTLSIPADIYVLPVKNGFSNPTKVQIGQGQYRRDVTDDCQMKALKEGCCEREQAQTDVSSTVKTSTKRELARATTKSRSEMKTVTK